jgi:CBS domain-containing protein
MAHKFQISVGVCEAAALLQKVKLKHIMEQPHFKPSATVQRDASVHSVIDIIRSSREGAVVVTDGHLPVGIFTERDLSDLLLSGANLQEADVGKEMSGNVVLGTKEMTLGEACALMRGNKVHHLPIASFLGSAIDDDTRVTHIVSQEDLLYYLLDVLAAVASKQ